MPKGPSTVGLLHATLLADKTPSIQGSNLIWGEFCDAWKFELSLRISFG